jgi:hypothetical protein
VLIITAIKSKAKVRFRLTFILSVLDPTEYYLNKNFISFENQLIQTFSEP